MRVPSCSSAYDEMRPPVFPRRTTCACVCPPCQSLPSRASTSLEHLRFCQSSHLLRTRSQHKPAHAARATRSPGFFCVGADAPCLDSCCRRGGRRRLQVQATACPCRLANLLWVVSSRTGPRATGTPVRHRMVTRASRSPMAAQMQRLASKVSMALCPRCSKSRQSLIASRLVVTSHARAWARPSVDMHRGLGTALVRVV